MITSWPLWMWLAASGPFVSVAERTQYEETGPLFEVDAFCRSLPGEAACSSIGISDGNLGITMVELGAKNKDAPVVLMLGGIHAGEIDGKDALFRFVRFLLDDKRGQALLKQVRFALVPVYNVDGFARFAENHRPNQRGPKETGWRTNARNLNLNRDWVKLDSREARTIVQVASKLDPIVVVDLHTTDGAKFQHDVALIVEPQHPQQSAMSTSAMALRSSLLATLTGQGHLPVPFYPSFEEDDRPESGIVGGITPGRFTHGYFALRDTIGVLVENHAWRTYKERVQSSYDVCVAVAEQAKQHGAAWLRERTRARQQRQTALPGSEVVLQFEADMSTTKPFAFQGYAVERTASAISGAVWTRYLEDKKQVWQIPLTTAVKKKRSVVAPTGGYVVDAAYADRVRPVLEAHGVRFSELSSTSMPLQSYLATKVTFGAGPYEGRQLATIEGAWQASQPQSVRPRSLFVPVEQPLSRLVVELFEPTSLDGFATWGFWSTHFEKKEYMEAYVAEEEARKMLDADKTLRAAFEERLRDPAFASNPQARLDFFYERHPSADDHRNRLPVWRCGRGCGDAAAK
jgi:hypothetical protein